MNLQQKGIRNRNFASGWMRSFTKDADNFDHRIFIGKNATLVAQHSQSQPLPSVDKSFIDSNNDL
ncbi:hypothetical protein AKJ16_DCAP01361 [Drosera capensis]